MAQPLAEAAMPIALEHHPGIIDEARLRDCRVAEIVWQRDRYRWRRPLAVFHILDPLALIDTLVVADQIVRPDRAAWRRRERNRRVRNAPARAGNDTPKRHRIVEHADIDLVGRARRSMRHCDPRAVRPIDRRRVNAAPCVLLVGAIAVAPRDCHTAPQVHAIDHDAELGGLNRRAMIEFDSVGELSVGN